MPPLDMKLRVHALGSNWARLTLEYETVAQQEDIELTGDAAETGILSWAVDSLAAYARLIGETGLAHAIESLMPPLAADVQATAPRKPPPRDAN